MVPQKASDVLAPSILLRKVSQHTHPCHVSPPRETQKPLKLLLNACHAQRHMGASLQNKDFCSFREKPSDLTTQPGLHCAAQGPGLIGARVSLQGLVITTSESYPEAKHTAN